MNRAWKLFDPDYIKELFSKEVLPQYPDFASIKRVRIIPHKDSVWEETYHVVLEYRVRFVTKAGKCKTLPIFCTAHSNEPRKNIYHIMHYLWQHGFDRGYSSAPHPLFYSEYFSAAFYRGVAGRTMFYYIKKQDVDTLALMIPKTAKWFAKLHRLPAEKARNFNESNSRIKTVTPGHIHILWRIGQIYPELKDDYSRIYDILINREEEFIAQSQELWLVHGDAHPENVIRMGKRKLALIDFGDMCVSDFARDLGTFIQQLEYMVMRKIGEQSTADKLTGLFLNSYLEETRRKLDDDLKERIKTYYLWTAMRTATHFLLKDFRQPDRAEPLLAQVRKELDVTS